MDLNLKNIHLENYKSFSSSLPGKHNMDCSFGKMTKISGRNRAGKSTIMDSYFDVLTNKLTDGSQPDKIRPHDNNGADIDRIDIIRELGLEIDGKPVTVTKKTAQKWRKPHGKTEEVFDGNITTYSIDGFEQKQKDFQKWQESIADPDVLMMCSNARPFLNTVQKSTAEARKLMERMSGFKIEDVIAQNQEYAQIEEITKGHSVEDALKQLRKNLNAQKKTAETVRTQLAYEKNRDVSGDIEISDLELAISDLNKRLDDLDLKEDALNNASKAYDEKSAHILELKSELSNVIAKANESLVSQRREINDKLLRLKTEKSEEENALSLIKLEIKHANMAIERHTKILKESRKNYSETIVREFDSSLLESIKAEVFDESSLICSECGQPYPTEMKNERMSKWEANKDRRIKEQENLKTCFYEKKNTDLERITEEGNKAALDLNDAKGVKKEAELKRDNIKSSIEKIDLQIKDIQDSLDKLPTNADLSENTEYKELTDKIATAEAVLKGFNVGVEARNELKSQRNKLTSEIAEKKSLIQKQIENEADKERRIERLEAELRAEGQKCADIEKNIDDLLNFSIEKNKALADMVNPYFKHFQFVFYDFTQEGGIYETLKIMCDGTDFFSGLNRSDQILCEIDLVCGLQKLNDLNLPVWVDNSEAVNADRLPEIEQQMIVLEVSDGPLTVEVM